ncbi:MAG: TIGR00153 family protein [Chlamydiia bacterium]|nr:TIGR00153 family protein [Chlamydiia bacterium]
MHALLNLFGKSPFAPLQKHMGKVKECVDKLPDVIEAAFKQDWQKVEEISDAISRSEYEADKIKNDIRNHLTSSVFLPIDRGQLLEILTTQDTLADRAEDIGVMLTYKEITLPDSLKDDFRELLAKNIAVFQEAYLIIREMDELLETSFGGIEAKKVAEMGNKVSEHEHEVDNLQKKVIKALYKEEDKMSFGTFLLWQKILSAISALSNLSEKLALLVRRTLESR